MFVEDRTPQWCFFGRCRQEIHGIGRTTRLGSCFLETIDIQEWKWALQFKPCKASRGCCLVMARGCEFEEGRSAMKDLALRV